MCASRRYRCTFPRYRVCLTTVQVRLRTVQGVLPHGTGGDSFLSPWLSRLLLIIFLDFLDAGVHGLLVRRLDLSPVEGQIECRL